MYQELYGLAMNFKNGFDKSFTCEEFKQFIKATTNCIDMDRHTITVINEDGEREVRSLFGLSWPVSVGEIIMAVKCAASEAVRACNIL